VNRVRAIRAGRVVAFKVSVEHSKYRGWCTECSWSKVSGGRIRGGSEAIDAARNHTKATGHETRLDATHQRGFKRRT